MQDVFLRPLLITIHRRGYTDNKKLVLPKKGASPGEKLLWPVLSLEKTRLIKIFSGRLPIGFQDPGV
jgi:hypothetical protein